MAAFTHILVPTDFGEASSRAVDVALSLAETLGCKVTLLHSYPIPASGYGFADGLKWPLDDLSAAAQAELDAAIARARTRYANVDGALACGEPWNEILQAATVRDADLIVMGTHGRRGLPRVLLGSVAEKIVRMSPVPVLTVSSRAEQEAKGRAVKEGRPAASK